MIKHLYRFSYEGAVDLEEVDMWLESHKENVRCKQSIEEMIREGFDGKTLRSDIAKDFFESIAGYCTYTDFDRWFIEV